MNKKFLIAVSIVVIIVVALSGCAKKTEQSVLTPVATEKSAKVAELECNVGAYSEVEGIKSRTTGIEQHEVNGKMMKLCCVEIEEQATNQKTKSCYVEQDYSLVWLANKETGWKYVKTVENYLKDNIHCTKLFDLQGNKTVDTCR